MPSGPYLGLIARAPDVAAAAEVGMCVFVCGGDAFGGAGGVTPAMETLQDLFRPFFVLPCTHPVNGGVPFAFLRTRARVRVYRLGYRLDLGHLRVSRLGLGGLGHVPPGFRRLALDLGLARVRVSRLGSGRLRSSIVGPPF